MEIQEFLSLVLPDSGEYYVLGGKKQLRTATAKTIGGAEAIIDQHIKKSENVFVALAGYAPGTSRKKPDVTGKKCFYVDIDCGFRPDGSMKDYPDKKAGFTALKKFISDSGMPVPTLIVDSGNGIHGYWVLDEVMIEAEWSSISAGIKRLAAKHGFKHDAAVMGDSARILRVPASSNWKDPTRPLDCKVIKNTGRTYSADTIRKLIPKESNIVPILGTRKFDDGGFDDLIATSNKPRYVKHILDECKVVHHTHETAGQYDDYNQWFAMLTLLMFCEDGSDFVHPFSNGHSQYSASVVSEKWQSRIDDKDAGLAHGATTCEAFHDMHPEICEQCPHWESPDRGVTWSSPLHFGLPAPADDIPYPFVRLANGNTGIGAKDEGGNMLIDQIFHGQVKNLQVFESQVGTTLYWEHHLQSKKRRSVEIHADSLVDPKGLKKALLRVPLIFTDAEIKGLRTMVESWVKQVQNSGGEIKAPSSFGWTKDGKRTGFRHADTVFWDDGSEQTVHTRADTGTAPIGVSGSYDSWKRMVAASLEAQHIETEVLIAAAFAAPLISMSHIDGAILSAVSLRSGTGKTTAMKLGQAVWGNPKTATFSLSDTANSILARMGLYNNLPAMWDDIRIPDNPREARQKVDMIYQITQGREKSRMTASVELRNVASWRTLLVCSSNTGLSNYISLIDQGGTAAQHRVLEFEVAPIDADIACDPIIFNEIDEHYGHAGTAYAKWMLANHSKCKSALVKNISAISKKITAAPEDRFTMTTIAAIYTAADFAEQAGIIKLDKAGILKFLVNAFATHRTEIATLSREVGAENNVVELLGMFMAEHQMNLLKMKTYPKRGPKNSTADNLIHPSDRETLLSVAVDDGEIRILKSVLDKWCRNNGRLGASRELCAVDGISSSRKVIGNASSCSGKALSAYCIRITKETEILFGELL